eukprot:SAG22_NODE_901_length_6600_cov_1.945854_7_plen_94_part_00
MKGHPSIRSHYDSIDRHISEGNDGIALGLVVKPCRTNAAILMDKYRLSPPRRVSTGNMVVKSLAQCMEGRASCQRHQMDIEEETGLSCFWRWT